MNGAHYRNPFQGYKISDLYYKPMMIVNDDSRVVNKLEASLTDDASHNLRLSHVYSTSHRVEAAGSDKQTRLNCCTVK